MVASTPGPTIRESQDGRAARGERTREAVAAAMLELLEEGDLRPTAPRVAERAGVALRTVFHHYEDMESLLSLAADTQLARVLAMTRRIDRAGPLDARIDALVAERARIYEAITPVRRAALLSEPFSPEIARRLRAVRDRSGVEVARVFAIELGALPAAARRETHEALTVATSWSAWEALRAHQDQTVAQARRVMARTLRALLKEHA